MNIGKGFTKSKIIMVSLVALVAIALVVTMVFLLKGKPQDKPMQEDETTQTDTPPADLPETDPTDTPVPESTPKPAEPSKPADTSKPAAPAKPAVTTYTVTFKSYDGKVLKTQTVEKGKAATAPDAPHRENFTFKGWDKDFKKVTSDLVVTATYSTTKSVIYAEHVSVNKGTGEVSVNIRVANNPGIMGAVLKVSVDDTVLGFKKASKTAYPSLTLTSPGPKTSASPYTFMLDSLELTDEDKKDGTLFTVTFTVKNPAATGKYDIKLSYDSGAVFDENYKDPKVCLESGSVTIK